MTIILLLIMANIYWALTLCQAIFYFFKNFYNSFVEIYFTIKFILLKWCTIKWFFSVYSHNCVLSPLAHFRTFSSPPSKIPYPVALLLFPFSPASGNHQSAFCLYWFGQALFLSAFYVSPLLRNKKCYSSHFISRKLSHRKVK